MVELWFANRYFPNWTNNILLLKPMFCISPKSDLNAIMCLEPHIQTYTRTHEPTVTHPVGRYYFDPTAIHCGRSERSESNVRAAQRKSAYQHWWARYGYKNTHTQTCTHRRGYEPRYVCARSARIITYVYIYNCSMNAHTHAKAVRCDVRTMCIKCAQSAFANVRL